MANLRTQNALLFFIALCLVLIVVHLYSDVDLVSKAQAQPSDQPRVHLYAYYCANNTCNWTPVMADDDGILLTKSAR